MLDLWLSLEVRLIRSWHGGAAKDPRTELSWVVAGSVIG